LGTKDSGVIFCGWLCGRIIMGEGGWFLVDNRCVREPDSGVILDGEFCG